MAIEFLTVEDVLYMHQNQVALYGGDAGVRDRGLLESAVAQAQASFDGNYLHDDLFDMAAAYLFHIVRNHPFIDGNKRAGAVAALVFLLWNGVDLEVDEDGLYDITIRVASGKADRDEVANHFRRLAR